MNISTLLMLGFLSIAAALSQTALAGNSQPEESSNHPDQSAPGAKKRVPPGFWKRGALPPRPVENNSPLPPTDVSLTNKPLTNTVGHTLPDRPAVDDKRVESPRGAAVLPVEDLDEAAKAAKARRAPVASGAVTEPTDRQEHQLESDLLRINASWLNLKIRPTAVRKIAEEAGVMVAALNEQLQANASLRGSDLLMANKISRNSGHSVDEVLAVHATKKQWLATGADLGIAPEVLLESANRVATVLR
jgi:hypothetical protein